MLHYSHHTCYTTSYMLHYIIHATLHPTCYSRSYMYTTSYMLHYILHATLHPTCCTTSYMLHYILVYSLGYSSVGPLLLKSRQVQWLRSGSSKNTTPWLRGTSYSVIEKVERRVDRLPKISPGAQSFTREVFLSFVFIALIPTPLCSVAGKQAKAARHAKLR